MLDILLTKDKKIWVKLLSKLKKVKKIVVVIKKYLFISLKLKLILENTNLFIKTFLGLLKDKIWFIEYLVKEYIFKNLNPELVEKKEPPIITKIKNIKTKLGWFDFNENPILEILVDTNNKLSEKSLLKLKKRKKIEIVIMK